MRHPEPAFGTPVNDSELSQHARLQARSHTPVLFVGGNYLDHGRGRDHTLLRSEVPTIAGARFCPFHAS
jgi:hypothetical protein